MRIATRLSTKIAFVTFIGAFVTILSVAVFTFHFTKVALQQSIMKNQLSLAKQTMNKIDRLLYERYIDIEVIAGEDLLEDFVLKSGAGLGSVDEIEKKAVAKRFNELTFVTGPWDVLFVVDQNGKTIFSTEEGEVGTSIEGEPHNVVAVKAAMQGEVYYSDMELSDDTHKPTLIFAAPIRDNQDPKRSVIGVVVGSFAWPSILPILEELPVDAILLDRSRSVIESNASYAKPALFAQLSQNRTSLHQFIGVHAGSMIVQAKDSFIGEMVLISFAPQRGYLSYEG